MSVLDTTPRILIVEDGVLNVTEVLHKLKAAGIEVDTSGDRIEFASSERNPFERLGPETLTLQCLRGEDPIQPEMAVRPPITYGPRRNTGKGKSRRW